MDLFYLENVEKCNICVFLYIYIYIQSLIEMHKSRNLDVPLGLDIGYAMGCGFVQVNKKYQHPWSFQTSLRTFWDLNIDGNRSTKKIIPGTCEPPLFFWGETTLQKQGRHSNQNRGPRLGSRYICSRYILWFLLPFRDAIVLVANEALGTLGISGFCPQKMGHPILASWKKGFHTPRNIRFRLISHQ